MGEDSRGERTFVQCTILALVYVCFALLLYGKCKQFNEDILSYILLIITQVALLCSTTSLNQMFGELLCLSILHLTVCEDSDSF